MYETLKRLLPRSFRVENETRIRRLLAVAYGGKTYRCNVCGTGLSRFIRTRGDLICPRCGSLMRNRRLWALLREGLLSPGTRVLDFSPSRALYRALKATPGISYVASDFADEFIADKRYDLTRLPIASASVDLLICYHVLEHIEDDRAAMLEMGRVLSDQGRALIQTPFRDGSIDEDPSVTTPEERLHRFGQADHVRTYSVDALKERLEEAGMAVEVRRFQDAPNNVFGFSPAEVVLVARRSRRD